MFSGIIFDPKALKHIFLFGQCYSTMLDDILTNTRSFQNMCVLPNVRMFPISDFNLTIKLGELEYFLVCSIRLCQNPYFSGCCAKELFQGMVVDCSKERDEAH